MTPISNYLIACATTYGHVFNIGQLTEQHKLALEKQVRAGTVAKASALWPWFYSGTCRKTCYVLLTEDVQLPISIARYVSH